VFPSAKAGDTLPFSTLQDFPESQVDRLAPIQTGPVGLLWDKSFLWGYLAVSTLRDLGFSFDLLTVADVRKGNLDSYRFVVVPGGWASLKSAALAVTGRQELRRYVEQGGGYLGICGGAGLALQVDEGLGLIPVARKPITERLPNFNGSIEVRPTSSHPLWWGLQEQATFKVWWPSQFELLESEKIKVLGQYGQPQSDFCVSDLNVRETQKTGVDWESLEEDYQINLDPERLLCEPAILEGKYGAGRVVLSYPHLETPEDAQGNLALFNIWHDLLGSNEAGHGMRSDEQYLLASVQVNESDYDCLRRIAREAEELVALGQRFQLWSWRNPWLLQWRRGTRGSEYGTICVLLRGLVEELQKSDAVLFVPAAFLPQEIPAIIRQLADCWISFKHKSQDLLEAEGSEFSGKSNSIAAVSSTETRVLRQEIFACVNCYGSRSYDGIYRQLLDQIDTLLLGALLANLTCPR
jgi:hypothetical protein